MSHMTTDEEYRRKVRQLLSETAERNAREQLDTAEKRLRALADRMDAAKKRTDATEAA